MRHHDKKRKFGREQDQYEALMRSLAYSLILKGKITTTEAKAKELRPFVEKLVTKARKPSLATTRLLISRLASVEAAKKLLTVSEKYTGRAGGYTRIVKIAPRKSDGARRAVIEFV